ncbi:unnamed protein product [Phytophthora lilii]|uniref:Unnamed protein product n=1 Tax=Phytophthora lilii TaxID=2077276 RepID=A0A9W6YJD8_9STRA|nr:unnamed protein product [Phytophthora lilii]
MSTLATEMATLVEQQVNVSRVLLHLAASSGTAASLCLRSKDFATDSQEADWLIRYALARHMSQKCVGHTPTGSASQETDAAVAELIAASSESRAPRARATMANHDASRQPPADTEPLLPADVHDIGEEGSDMTRDIFFAILKEQDGPPRPKSLPDQSEILHEDIGALRWWR